MRNHYSDEDLASWAEVFNNVSDFLVTKGGGQLLLGAELQVRDSNDKALTDQFQEQVALLESPYPPGSLADRVWLVREAAAAIGADWSFDDTPWDLAGMYLADAMEFIVEDASLENDAAEKRRLMNLAEEGEGAVAPAFQWLLAEERRRRSATASLAAMFTAQEAAFFEAAEWYQLPVDEADRMSRQGFPKKWQSIYDWAGMTIPDSTQLVPVQECFEYRHRLVHIPPRIRRTCTPEDVLANLLPSNEQMREWVQALAVLLEEYFEGLDLEADLPSWETYAGDREYKRRLAEGLPTDDLLDDE